MSWIDCTDVDSAATCIAECCGTDVVRLQEAILGYDESRFDDMSEDPYERMPRELLGLLGCDVESLYIEGAYYFHGTRLIGLEDIRREGILPINQVVERIWAMLYDLVRDVCSPRDWTRFRNFVENGGAGYDGSLYRWKTGEDASSFGPFAVLVRETLLKSEAVGNHDYLDCPEIVQDIARCFKDRCGVDLEQRFREASQPVIVKFRSAKTSTGTVRAALWYLYSILREGEVSSNANDGFDGDGHGVAADDVIEIEEMS